MTSPCKRITDFFNPFAPKSNGKSVDRPSRKRKRGDTEASSLNQIVRDTLFPIVTPHNRTCHFPRLGSQVLAHGIGSFLADRDLVSFSNTNKAVHKQLDSILEIKQRSIFSSILIFDKKKYKDYWGVEITDEFEPAKINKRVLRIFLKTYFGPNPVDPTKLVKDTCLIPTVVPVRVMVEGRSFGYNLNLLDDIASHPGIGNAASINYHRFNEFGGVKSPKQAYIEIVFPGVIGRGECCGGPHLQDLKEQTGYGCETEPDALGLVTAAFAEYAVRGNRAFGDPTGMEGRFTYSYTRGLIQLGEDYICNVIIGGFRYYPWRHPDPAVLDVGLTWSSNGESDGGPGTAIQWKCAAWELEPLGCYQDIDLFLHLVKITARRVAIIFSNAPYS